MTPLFRDELFAAAERAAYPPEPFLDEATGVSSFDADGAAAIERIFELFGVTALASNDSDLDRVLNTTCTLSAEVALDVHSLNEAGGDLAGLPEAADWHEDYRAYVNALWHGDREQIVRSAAALGLSAGIPNGSLPLQNGPLA